VTKPAGLVTPCEPEAGGSKQVVVAAACLIGILAASLAFKLAFTPRPLPGAYSLVITPAIFDAVASALAHHPGRLLLPMEYEPGRYYWLTTAIFFLYGLYKLLSPLGVYCVLSSILVATIFICSWLLLRSVAASVTIALCTAFGTQFSYALTYGTVLAQYLVLAYAAVNLTIAAKLVSSPNSRRLQLAYLGSLAWLALSSEMWINYAVAMIVAGVCLCIWQRKHGLNKAGEPARFVTIGTLGVLAAYLAVSLRYAGQYAVPGVEEELVLTYRNPVFLADDVITNFFTLLYTSLSNFLPAFLTGSTSLVYFGEHAIIAGQNGYDLPHTALVGYSHLFMWRFYAGAVVALFFVLTVRWVRHALATPAPWPALLALLSIMVVASFPTHLLIKFRPYMSVPALQYKVIFSVFFQTLLIGCMTERARQWLPRRTAYHAGVGALWAVVILSGLTRPRMLSELLARVGLAGYGDPLGDLLRWLR